MGRPSHDDGTGADAYLLVDARKQGVVKGEASAPGHEEEITVKAWHWGLSSPTAVGSSQATGRRVYQVLRVDKHVDASSTKLMNALANNEDLKKVSLGLRKAGTDEDFFTIVLEQARVVGCEIQSEPNGALNEVVAIAYQAIEITYHPQKDSGDRGASTSFSDSFNVQA